MTKNSVWIVWTSTYPSGMSSRTDKYAALYTAEDTEENRAAAAAYVARENARLSTGETPKVVVAGVATKREAFAHCGLA